MSAEARLKERTSPCRRRPARWRTTWAPCGRATSSSSRATGPIRDGKATSQGKVGKDLTVEQGYQVAREVGLALLATVRANLGSLDKVRRVVKVLGMVNSADGFGDQPKVINGFSDLMVEVFGEAIGKHARSAVGHGRATREHSGRDRDGPRGEE